MELTAKHRTIHSPASKKDVGPFFSFDKTKSVATPFFQPKLTVNQPNDVYEKEADAVAEQVMKEPTVPKEPLVKTEPSTSTADTIKTKSSTNSEITPLVSASINTQSLQRNELAHEEEEQELNQKPSSQSCDKMMDANPEIVISRLANSVQKKCAECEEEEEGKISRKENGIQTTDSTSSIEQTISSHGQPLPAETLSFMEERFGHDFGNVQIHNDALAHQSSAEINALAYTHQNHIAFGDGQYQPDSEQGKKLLAHELTHTIQQSTNRDFVQRSMKFEFQTHNIVWRVKDLPEKEDMTEKETEQYAKAVLKFKPDPNPLGRKYGPKGDDTEDGSEIAFLSAGKHGEKATKAGDILYVEAEGPLAMKPIAKDEKGYDWGKPAQFIKVYRFKVAVNRVDILDKQVVYEQLELVEEKNNTTEDNNPNKFLFKYLNSDNKDLDVHLDESGVFKEGTMPLKVDRLESVGIDKNLQAQFIEIWKVTKSEKPTAVVALKDDMVELEQISVIDNATVAGMEGKYNAGTYKRIYYDSSNFTGKKLNENAVDLKVHVDDGRLKSGVTDFLKQRKVVSKESKMTLGTDEEWEKEQTGIELQSEHRGVLEFETPKWFRDWKELKVRIEDASNMTTAINKSEELSDSDITSDGKILKAMRKKVPSLIKADKRENYPELKKVVKWPKEFDTSHLKKLHTGGEKLFVEIVDEKWHAKIQTSEGIALSQYSALQREHEGSAVEKIHHDNMKAIFTAAGHQDIVEDDNRFASLKGFLQLIVTYIYRGQVKDLTGDPSKFGFTLMARTDFASMYRALLNDDEKKLFKEMVKDMEQKILTTELEVAINSKRKKEFEKLQKRLDDLKGKAHAEKETKELTAEMKRMEKVIKLKGDLPFFFAGHAAGNNPTIKEWLISIWKKGETKIGKGITREEMEDSEKYKDKLSAGSQSASMGARSVSSEYGDKDYNLGQFEVRSSIAPSNWMEGDKKVEHKGNDLIPAEHWLEYIEQTFKRAEKRSADTPDEPTTQVNEAAKTSLKIPPVKEDDEPELSVTESNQSQKTERENEIEINFNPIGGTMSIGYGRNFRLLKNLTLRAGGSVLVDLKDNNFSGGATIGGALEYHIPQLENIDLRLGPGMKIIGKLSSESGEPSLDYAFILGASIKITKRLRVSGELTLPVLDKDLNLAGGIILSF